MPATDYSKWDALYDSDEERKKEEEEKKKANASLARAGRARGVADPLRPGGGAAGIPALPGGGNAAISKEQMLEQYSKALNKRPKMEYKFPDTIEEQTVICEAADELRKRGNAHYRKGELVEAAKLYEQAVLKFADWYAECFATDEERALVHAVKLPSHLNLAACSWRLGNYEHAVMHCTQVLQHDPKNVKALFRRGASSRKLGDLEQARADLKLASELAQSDLEIRKECALLSEQLKKYKATNREMYNKALAGAGGSTAASGDGDRGEGEGEGGEGSERSALSSARTAPRHRREGRRPLLPPHRTVRQTPRRPALPRKARDCPPPHERRMMISLAERVPRAGGGVLRAQAWWVAAAGVVVAVAALLAWREQLTDALAASGAGGSAARR
ncbi:hypothetical protein AB1Y20_021199 [Prymnesium parvum]|uniref:peptidylprolyl isomerase n=1 Tax=Prymnesium parvum TaxID=97485 RepID=A0AB34JIZ0_PRYPA